MNTPKGATVVTTHGRTSYASIQVQTTDQTGDSIEVCDSDSPRATHWSVYLRGKDGLAEWVADYPIRGKGALAKTSALLKAVELSQQYHAYIESIC